MLCSPRSLLSAVVASLMLASATNAAALQARQSASALRTTCNYTWSCDGSIGYYQVKSVNTALRCTRNNDNEFAAQSNNMTVSCYYPNHGGDSATGVSSARADNMGVAKEYCPTYAIRTSTADSCTTVQRRALDKGPHWSSSRQAVVRRDADGNKKVVPRSEATAETAEPTPTEI